MYSSPNIIRAIKPRKQEWAGNVARVGDKKGVHMISVGRPEEERPLGRPMCREDGDIKIVFQGRL